MSSSSDERAAETPPGWRHCLACGVDMTGAGGGDHGPYCVECTEPGGRPS
ncbi:MAG: hypothetical protein ABEJ05_12065 [Haloglomus sp.]